ncbi:MAG: DNA sulfur modification protein DndD [Xenococcus sp. MO_188.B8]|nr:DNA sulfur modification protein DndD [Xenococcus sp. MO_188.B8]
MIFTELVLENFGAYADRNIINLRPDNNGVVHPIILIGGMNGGGKTTLIDAIRLALYGHRAQCSSRNHLSYGDFLTQLANNKITSGQVTNIELSFEHIHENHWQEFKIIRSWNKHPQEGKDSLSVIREGTYDPILEENWDEYIEAILPLGISNLFLFDGEQVKELAESDEPSPSVIEAINTLLGLELSKKLAVDLDVLVSRKQKSLTSKEQLQTIEELEDKIYHKKQEIEIRKDNLITVQSSLKKAQQKLARTQNKFCKEGGRIAAESNQLQEKIKLLDKTIEEQREKLKNIAGTSLPLMLVSDLLSAAVIQGQQEVKIHKFQQAKNIIAERDRKLLTHLQKETLPEDTITKVKSFIFQENQYLFNSLQSQQANYLDITEEELQQLISLQKDRISYQKQSATETMAKLQQLKLEKEQAESQLATAASPEEYKKLDDAVKKAQKEVNKSQRSYLEEQHKIETLVKEIEQNQQRIKKILQQYSTQAIDNLEEEHLIKTVARVQDTLKIFSEKLTLKKLNKLETEVTECFRYLLHKSNLVHRVSIETETYRITLYDPQGQLLPKQRLSAGEKQLLAIAFLWSLARVSGKNLPVAIDTPLGRLDSSHRSNLIQRYFPCASHQVILLSTDTEIGKEEIKILRLEGAITREYLLQYSQEQHQTKITAGYFW